MKWASYPFLKITPVFMLGILLGESLHISCPSALKLMLLSIASLLFCSLIFWTVGIHFHKNLLALAALLFFGWLGYLDIQASKCTQTPGIEKDSLANVTHYTAIIDNSGDSTGQFIKYKARILYLKKDGAWMELSKSALLFIRKDTLPKLSYGDELLVQSRPQLVANQQNPEAFDYGLYLQRKGIYLQNFIETSDYSLISAEKNTSIRYWPQRTGDYLAATITRYIPAARERNVIMAMLLGRRNEISPEMEYVYESTGTSHILAVSGLHVGIVYWILKSLFSFLRNRKNRWLLPLLVLAGIWAFALVTGLSPSVQRAATMFSFIIVSRMLWKRGNIYNTILASAFFILFFTPALIYSVSFQLSYAAVLGIVLLYPKIYPLVYVPTRFLDFFWQITVLSISVQIATFPITIFYFNQFPVLFAFTNLLAIPAVIFILIGSFVLLTTSSIAFIAKALAFLLERVVFWYNEAMVAFSKLPFALITGLYLKPYQVFVLILLTVFLLRFMVSKKLVFFQLFAITLLFLSGINLYMLFGRQRQQKVVFYHVARQRYHDVFAGDVCFTNTLFSGEEADIYFNILPYRRSNSQRTIHDLDRSGLTKSIGKNKLFVVQGQRILLLNDLKSMQKPGHKIRLDYLIVGSSTVDQIKTALQWFQVKTIVLDSTVPLSRYVSQVEKWGEGHVVHALERDGALIVGK
ncbi:MAG: ComEC family competence protein [Cyclobacteriaceae bacterium]|nr:ComEC family competence protein [Cyclobacteriaceae bacterium]